MHKKIQKVTTLLQSAHKQNLSIFSKVTPEASFEIRFSTTVAWYHWSSTHWLRSRIFLVRNVTYPYWDRYGPVWNPSRRLGHGQNTKIVFYWYIINVSRESYFCLYFEGTSSVKFWKKSGRGALEKRISKLQTDFIHFVCARSKKTLWIFLGMINISIESYFFLYFVMEKNRFIFEIYFMRNRRSKLKDSKF